MNSHCVGNPANTVVPQGAMSFCGIYRTTKPGPLPLLESIEHTVHPALAEQGRRTESSEQELSKPSAGLVRALCASTRTTGLGSVIQWAGKGLVMGRNGTAGTRQLVVDMDPDLRTVWTSGWRPRSGRSAGSSSGRSRSTWTTCQSSRSRRPRRRCSRDAGSRRAKASNAPAAHQPSALRPHRGLPTASRLRRRARGVLRLEAEDPGGELAKPGRQVFPFVEIGEAKNAHVMVTVGRA